MIRLFDEKLDHVFAVSFLKKTPDTASLENQRY